MKERDHIPTVVLVGRPNVGKSTLFNRLTRSRDALVDPTPGLTRDRRHARINWDDLNLEIWDTGGMGDGEHRDAMTRLVHEQSLKAVEGSDLLLILVDARQGLTPSDREIVESLRRYEKPCIIVVNKVDNSSQESCTAEFFELGIGDVASVSAEHGRGVKGLMERIAAVLSRSFPARGESPPDIEESGADADGPMRIAVVGRPNVGKSSLLNRLVGEPRMIVTDIPGTTRDAVDTLIHRHMKRDALLTDTAGIRRKARVSDRVEKFSVIKAIDVIKDCDVALVVLDATEGITDQDKRLIGYVDEYGRGGISLFNKWDLIQGDQSLIRLRAAELKRAKRFVSYTPHLNISARTGRNTDKILPLVDSLYDEFTASVNTGKLNQVLQKAMAMRSPPMARGHQLRFYYTTQVASKPPTFLVFANYPKEIPVHYRRFLANQFREQLGLSKTPIRLLLRQRERRP
jgi:GTP-binding protein